MKQKIKEKKLQTIPLQEARKAYQIVLWDICLSFLLLTGSLISFSQSWGQKTGMGWLIALTSVIGMGCNLLAEKAGKKVWIRGVIYGTPWLAVLLLTGLRGYLSGFLSWINAIITGWNLSREGAVALFQVQTTEQCVRAFTLVIVLLCGEGILTLVKKKQCLACAVLTTAWIVVQLLGNTYSPVACAFLLAGFAGVYLTGKKTWLTGNMICWTVGIAVFLCAVGIFSDRADMEMVRSFREQVEQEIHEVRYGKDSLPEGNLYEASGIHENTDVMLEVQSQQEKDLYLRGYVGGVYRNGQWEELPDSAYSGENAGMLAWLKKKDFDPLTQVAQYYQLGDQQDKLEDNQVQINVKEASRYYVYAPASYIRMVKGNVGEEKDSRLASKGFFGRRTYRWDEISGTRPGELTIADNWVQQPENDRQKTYQEAESVYREFVYHTYTTIDPDMQRLMEQVFWEDYTSDSDGIYSALDQIRKRLSEETTYTEVVAEVPEGEDPIRWFLTEGKEGNDVYYAATAAEAFRAYGIPARYVEGYYLSADDIHNETSGTDKLTGTDAHAWVEVYFDGVGWLPLDATPGYYYDAVSLQQMISTPDQVSKNAALEDPSFEANQAADTENSKKSGKNTMKRVVIRAGAVMLGSVTLLLLLAILCLALLEIGRILDYERMYRKFARANQKEKVRIYTDELQKLLAYLGISMSLGWKTREVDREIHEKYQGVENGSYLRVCEILEKSIYGQQKLEAYEMRTIIAFMEKLETIGKDTFDWKERIGLRYGYIARIYGKFRQKTGQKRKTEKNSRKELTK
jgi:transglutaminase-like putative cysteine protease